MVFAYIDVRPFLYLAGLPVAFALAWFVAHAKRWRFGDELFLISTFAAYTALFVFIFAGPFVGRQSIETHDMTWAIATVPSRVPSSCRHETEVKLKFVDDPGRVVSICSDKLAAHLRQQNKPIVPADFIVIRDYWNVRSSAVVEISGLKRSSWL